MKFRQSVKSIISTVIVLMLIFSLASPGLISAAEPGSEASPQLIQNGSFDNWDNWTVGLPDYWTNPGGGTLSKTAGKSGDGARLSSAGFRFLQQENIYLETNTDYSIGFWAKKNTGSEAAAFNIQVFNYSYGIIDNDWLNPVRELDGWTYYSFPFNSSGNSKVFIRLNISSAADYNYVIDFDDITLQKNFDSGMIINGAFEQWTEAVLPPNQKWVPVPWSVNLDSSWFDAGVAGLGYKLTFINQFNYLEQVIQVQPNTAYKLSFYAKKNTAANSNAIIQAAFPGYADNKTFSEAGQSMDNWTLCTTSFKTTTETSRTLRLYGYSSLGDNFNGCVVWFDNVKIEAYPDAPSGITLTKAESGDFVVGIDDWNPAHSYQIWTYQKTVDALGMFNGKAQEENQWILSKPYTLGSDRSTAPDASYGNRPTGFAETSGVLEANIGSFNSIDSNFTVAVKVIDGSGNFVGQYKDTFTQAEAGVVAINKVTVDGVFADDKAFVKEIKAGASVSFAVTGNGVADTVYTAKIDQTGTALTAAGAGLNEFSWDISTMQPGSYSVTLTAATATSSDNKTVNLKLYKNDPTIVYGELTSLSVAGGADSGNFRIDMTPAVTGGKFRYTLSEPWRSPIAGGDSGLIDIPAGLVSNAIIPETAYGIYQVATYTYRDGVASADDGAVRSVNNARPGGAGLTVLVDDVDPGSSVVVKGKGTAMALTAQASGIPNAEYSFWRRDANGWVMIRDWGPIANVPWSPNRVGLYTIQVRAKEAGGLTYEAVKNIEFEVTHATETKAVVTDITINDLSGASSRTPILITANAIAGTSQDLLYKYIISNGFIYSVETAYSADPTYMWVPGKAGNYTISVLVKNQVSFGKYDAVESFTVTVN